VIAAIVITGCGGDDTVGGGFDSSADCLEGVPVVYRGDVTAAELAEQCEATSAEAEAALDRYWASVTSPTVEAEVHETTGTVADSPTAAPATTTTTAITTSTTSTVTMPPYTTPVTESDVLYDPALLGQLGDCFNEEPDALVRISCEDPHDYQIVLANGVIDAPLGAAYPTDTEMAEWEQLNCVPALESFTGLPTGADDIEFVTFPPTTDAWDEGERAVWCAGYRGETRWIGSLASSR
jgi:hypothetical protein